MRPMKLVMRAFGPYAKEQVLDFSVLEERSLFLIHGPTGAGKTSILDAICFALYGETSGAERQVRHMRSDHADPGALTEVTFDFALGRDIYRVTRQPEQERPKKRGHGMTKESAKATLWRRADPLGDHGRWTVVADRWSRVNEEIERILGFRSDQFRQVVVLPQGQFRRLLSAGSSERQQILEVLFQTGIYRRIEEALKEAADQIRGEVERLREREKEILERAGVERLSELEEKLSRAAKEKEAIEDSIKALRQREASAEKELENAKEAIRKLEEYERAKIDLQKMEARKGEFKEKVDKLARARRASTLKDIQRELRNREEELAEAQKQLETTKAALEGTRQEKARAEEEFHREKERQGERDSARREVDKLESLREQVEGLARARQRLEELEKRARGLARIHDQKKTRVEECERALQRAQREREAAITLAAQVDTWKVEHDNIRRACERRRQLAELRRELERAEAGLSRTSRRLEEAEKERDVASRKLDLLQERWRKGQAAVLARELEPGTPCPVCGSLEHPSPARPEGDLPTESDLDAAQRQVREMDGRLKDLREQVSSSRDRVVKLEAQIRSLEAELEGYRDEEIPTLEQRAGEVKARLDEAERAKALLPDLEERMEALTKERELAEDEARHAQDQLQEGITELAVAKRLVERSESEIPRGLRTRDRLEDAIGKAKQKHRQLEDAFQEAQDRLNKAVQALARAEVTLKGAKESEAKARCLLHKAREEFLGRLKEAGFVDTADYEASLMADEEMEQLDAHIQEFNGRLREATERLRRAQREVEGLQRPEIEPLERECAEIKRELEEALRRSGEASKHMEQLGSGASHVEKVQREIGEKEAHYRVVGRLAEVATGRNQYNITLERFVLAALLDDVLFAASARLNLMSNGRFDLQRLAGIDDRRRAGGLELVVYDAYTGTTRPVNTLSGGEGFLASLSLALGLADVVQSHAGGIRLDTIFIDEGFGSLDPESLDLALRALVDLQEEGRLVGIISHVPELKERVDARLEVVPGRRGSVARFVL